MIAAFIAWDLASRVKTNVSGDKELKERLESFEWAYTKVLEVIEDHDEELTGDLMS